MNAVYVGLLVILTSICNVSGAGFDYPPNMPSPHEVVVFNNVLTSYAWSSNGIETPVVIRLAHIGTVGAWNCVAQYDADALDANTFERPIVSGLPNDEHLNSFTRALCLTHVYGKIMNIFYPPVLPYYNVMFKLWGIDDLDFEINSNVIECNHDKDCLNKLAEENNYYPAYMASIIANEIVEEYTNDGWNWDGSLTRTGEACTANCQSYTDTTDYQPQQQSDQTSTSTSKSKRDLASANTDNDDDFYVPLIENDGYGFFFKDEHVTPHIGIDGKLLLLDEYKSAPDPEYDYNAESELLLNRLKLLAVNDTMKILVEHFNNKLKVRGMIGLALLRQYQHTLTYENFINYIIGISMSEYDAVLQAWNQKIVYDLIRPTTVIQRKGNEIIETYGGPYKGIQIFEAKDFEPFIRVMPHSEYPSASACICIAYMQFVHDFVSEEFDDVELENLVWYYSAGSSSIERDVTPEEDILLEIKNMEELYSICSESRLWGGMHFTQSIHAAKEICDGIGNLGYISAVKLKENSNFLGSHVLSEFHDIEEYWLPYLKLLDFMSTISIGNILMGNLPDFDIEILKVFELFIPDINIDQIGENFMTEILPFFLNLISGIQEEEMNDDYNDDEAPIYTQKAKSVVTNNDIFYTDEAITTTNLSSQSHILLIFSVFVVALLFLCVGIWIGSKYISQQQQHIIKE